MVRILITFLLLSNHSALAHGRGINHSSREEVIDSIIKAADFVGVPRELPLALCWVESSYRRSLPRRMDGHTPSYGICQIKLETAQYVDKVYKHKYKISITKLTQVSINAIYACKYLKLQLKRYNNDWRMAVDAYNKGRLVSVNSKYVRKVHAAMLERAVGHVK